MISKKKSETEQAPVVARAADTSPVVPVQSETIEAPQTVRCFTASDKREPQHDGVARAYFCLNHLLQVAFQSCLPCALEIRI